MLVSLMTFFLNSNEFVNSDFSICFFSIGILEEFFFYMFIRILEIHSFYIFQTLNTKIIISFRFIYLELDNNLIKMKFSQIF